MRQTNWDTSISAPDVSEVKIGNLCSIFGGPCQLFDLFSPPSLAVDIDAIVEFDELPRGVHKVKCDFLSISESRIHVPHPNFHDLALYVRSTTTTSFLPGAFQIERRSYFCSPIERPDSNPLRSLPPTSSIRQKKIEQNGKKQHKKTAIALVDLAT